MKIKNRSKRYSDRQAEDTGRVLKARTQEHSAREQIKEALDPIGFRCSDAEENHIVSEKLHNTHNMNVMESDPNANFMTLEDWLEEINDGFFWDDEDIPIDLIVALREELLI